MIELLATGLAAAAFISGLLLLAVWGRRRLMRLTSGSHPHRLEVTARVGLHTNQGLAVVRVGSRHWLVSCGEGGARMLAELDPSDLESTLPVSGHRDPIDFQSVLRRKMGIGVLVLAALSAPDLSAQQIPDPSVAPWEQLSPYGRFIPPGQGPISPYGLQGQWSPGMFGPVYEALPGVDLRVGDDEGGFRLTGTVGTVIVLGLLSLAPSLLLLTTAFTRILIVLHLLRQALGTQNTPPGHLLAGLAILLTMAVMAPTFDQVRVYAVDPWVAGEIEEGEMITRAIEPMRAFMFSQTREADLATFLRISQTPPPMSPADIPHSVLMSAFVTSELRTAFEIGFAIFLPFIVIDLVVAAVLTSMGMFMLPPTMIALPCKLMLFVLMDGWTLLMGALAQSFL
ncbi:MAG: flagellar type III secretion system pore protein FliP [Gemmatimonadota bacterium]